MPAMTADVTTFYSAIRHLKPGLDIPLFIIENPRKPYPDSYWSSIDADMRYFPLDTPYIYESLLAAIIKAQDDRCPLMINIKADPHPLVISLLNRISQEGAIDIDERDGRSRRTIEITSPIMAVITRDLLEHGISYRRFYDLFGAGLSI